MEYLNFRIQTGVKSTIRGTLAYQPPGSRSSFCNFIAPLAIDFNFLWDLNFHLDDLNNTTTLLDNMKNIGFSQLICNPMHIAGTR